MTARTNVPVGTYGRGSSAFARSGVTPTVGDTVNGMTIANDGRTCVDIKNTNGTTVAHVATFRPSPTIEGQSVTVPISIAAGATEGFGPFPLEKYGSHVKIDAAHAELTFLAFRVPLE